MEKSIKILLFVICVLLAINAWVGWSKDRYRYFQMANIFVVYDTHTGDGVILGGEKTENKRIIKDGKVIIVDE